MRTWWSVTGLVLQRGLLENLRSKAFKVVTGILLLLSAAAVMLPQVFVEDTPTYTLATIGEAPPEVKSALESAGEAGDFNVQYASREGQDGLRTAVRDGDATVGLADDKMYAAAEGAGTFPAVVAQVVVTLETSQQLTDAGLSEQQLAELRSVRAPEQVTIGAVEDEGRAAVGLAVGIVLNLALLFGGSAIATTVALEKTTRISEVLLAVIRPSQVLVGTVLAVGAVTLIQLLVLGAPLAVALQVSDDIGAPAAAAGDIALGILWFLLGFALYAFMYAACGALVHKVTEVDTAVRPVALTVLGGYFVAIIIVMEDPQSLWSVVASIFPLSAPLTMPLRWASGDVPTYQLLVAMLLTAGTAVAFAALASTIYRRALLITGHRVRFREVVGHRASAQA